MESFFVGRQPILDRAGSVYGYELLHRQFGEEHAAIDDGDRISADLLIKTILEVGVEQISGAHRAFINVTGNLLKHSGLETLPSDRIVLEVLEDVAVDAELLGRLTALHRRKFEIALDDFVCMPSRDALIDHADIVKLDVLALDDASLEQHAVTLKRRGVRLLGEKVENHAMHERLLGLGFDLFQGYFFARPETYSSRTISANKMVVLELLARVNEPAVTPQEVANIVRGDVSMSVTVLRWANGSFYGLKQAVDSIERAIIVLGLQTVRNWVSLKALGRMGAQPSELLTVLLVRARTCELMAAAAKRANPAAYFTVGLLSGLDIVMHMSMAQALELIPLAQDQKAALLAREGELGAALKAVNAMELGDWSAASCMNLTIEEITHCYLRAINWADGVSSAGI
jgi:EAL and modified HD-GYP domain-containing signal transduction protein